MLHPRNYGQLELSFYSLAVHSHHKLLKSDTGLMDGELTNNVISKQVTVEYIHTSPSMSQERGLEGLVLGWHIADRSLRVRKAPGGGCMDKTSTLVHSSSP